MGACASTPKDIDSKEEDAPIEAPTPKKPEEVEAVTQEDNKEGDEKKDAPLIDLSDEKKEEEEEEKTEQPSEPEVATETEKPAEQPPVSENKSDE